MQASLVLQETTGLVEYGKDSFYYPAHTYYLNDASPRKLIAYKKEGTDTIIELSKPMKFDRARRKFKEISRL